MHMWSKSDRAVLRYHIAFGERGEHREIQNQKDVLWFILKYYPLQFGKYEWLLFKFQCYSGPQIFVAHLQAPKTNYIWGTGVQGPYMTGIHVAALYFHKFLSLEPQHEASLSAPLDFWLDLWFL